MSSTPGRTQHINLFRLADAAVFADLPGYGFARVPVRVREAWKHHIEAYLSEREALCLVVVLVDARRDPQDSDGQLIDALAGVEIPVLVVATKVDKLKRKQQRARQLAAIRRGLSLPAGQPIPFSAMTGEGRDAVWDAIEAACRGDGDGT